MEGTECSNDGLIRELRVKVSQEQEDGQDKGQSGHEDEEDEERRVQEPSQYSKEFSLDPLLEEQEDLLEKLNNWNFQIFELMERTGGKSGRILSCVSKRLRIRLIFNYFITIKTLARRAERRFVCY